jgi:transposase InsO family protein
VELLAVVDAAHERLSGPATRHILKREFERLARLSNGHLYNLRRNPGYRLLHYEKTRPTVVQIGERKKPAPNGQPGFLRIDTVHQGDGPEGKGIYHINAVDEIAQWEVVLATPRISEAWLMPLLESILQQFPFLILNFHSDNGSEFIDKTVALLLEKLLIEQTKSRPRKSGDNGLVETKNAAIAGVPGDRSSSPGVVMRKHIGWGHIAPAHAAPINQFHTGFLNPYITYHRPSAQAEVQIDAKGRKRRIYKQWQTPFEKLLSLDRPQLFLRAGLSIGALKRVAATMRDTEAARRMQQAKNNMFEQIRRSA